MTKASPTAPSAPSLDRAESDSRRSPTDGRRRCSRSLLRVGHVLTFDGLLGIALDGAADLKITGHDPAQ
jgi:hypothetical protein